MPIEGKLGSLYIDKEQTQPLFPRTKTKAITDDDNIRLDITLDSLKTTVNSKASEAFVMNAIANAQLGGGEGEIDLSGFATKDDITNLDNAIKAIDYPVDSVNGKTGAVTLSASDIGAVKKSGDTMTGALTTTVFTVDSDMPTIGFNETDAKKSYHIVQGNRHYLRSTASDTDFYEQFRTPTPSTGLTGNKSYDFLTTKSPVTIGQGGTGATTAVEALDNLKALNIDHINDNAFVIPSGANLNDYVTPGAYTIRSASIAGSLINGPSYKSAGARLIVSATSYTSTGIIQVLIFNTTGRQIWYRIRSHTGTWGEWDKIGSANYTVDTSVSGLTLVKSNNIVHAHCHTGYALRTGVIPSGYRPKNALNLFGLYIDSNYTDYDAIIKIETDGTIHENHTGQWDTGSYWVRFQASWQV